MHLRHDYKWLKVTVNQSLTEPGFQLDKARLKSIKMTYDALSLQERKDFNRFFILAYGRYSGKLDNAKWAFLGSILLPLCDIVINQQISTYKLIALVVLGNFMGFMGGRRTSAFFQSGHYYKNIKKVNETFKKIDQTLQLDSYFLRFTDNETEGLIFSPQPNLGTSEKRQILR